MTRVLRIWRICRFIDISGSPSPESFSRASVDILILLAWNIVLFMLAYVSFLRYEMS